MPGDTFVDDTLKSFAEREAGDESWWQLNSGASDFFFRVVFVATAMSIVSGAVAEQMKLWAFLVFSVVAVTGYLPGRRFLDLGCRRSVQS